MTKPLKTKKALTKKNPPERIPEEGKRGASVKPKLIQAIRESNISNARAAALFGLSYEAVRKWIIKDPDFAKAVAKARSEWLKDRLAELRECKTKWGTPDSHALIWLIERSFRDEYGPKGDGTVVNVSAHANAQAGVVLTPEFARAVQERRAAALGKPAGESLEDGARN